MLTADAPTGVVAVGSEVAADALKVARRSRVQVALARALWQVQRGFKVTGLDTLSTIEFTAWGPGLPIDCR
ncbi:hypothetical protein GCM10023350_23170 [Nocardioides endophyticus]|uniref:Uncharacterized protein n=1 Tax=Nocardioides endophyticus TaxID=1353775 RepID=A0ABP8YVK8_9ACTN